MLHLLDFVHEYQLLRTKKEQLQISLQPSERARLAMLEPFLKQPLESGDDRRAMRRFDLSLPVEFTLPGGFGGGFIVNLSAGGMAVVTTQPREIGGRTILRMLEPNAGLEYVFPARVTWHRVGEDVLMGVMFEGVPYRAPVIPGREHTRDSIPI